MEKTVMISMQINELQTVIIDCVNSCLRQNKMTESQKSDSDQLLTIKQASDLLHLSVPTVYGLVSRSEIPCMKKGKRLYFSKEEISDWIKSGKKKTISELSAEADTYLLGQKKGGKI